MSTNFSFGFKPTTTTTSTPIPTQPTGNLSFGLSSTNAASAPLQFGLTSNAPSASSTTPLQFAAQSTPSTAGFSLGLPAPSLNFSSAFKPTSTASTTTTIGATSATLLSTNTTSSQSLAFPLASVSQSPASAATSFGTNVFKPLSSFTVAPSTSNVNVQMTIGAGLGGIADTSVKTSTTKTSAQKEIAPKDQPLPNEIFQTVESLKSFIKREKICSSDISRYSVKEFKKVEEDVDLLLNILKEVQVELNKNRSMTEKLKYDTAKGLQYVEMAQRTQDTPPGLQYDNIAPMHFFIELTDKFEKEMHDLKIQLETVHKWMKTSHNSGSVTPEDISLGMKQLYETFVALAGRFQTIHGQVENQKENFLSLRKSILNDATNVFERDLERKEVVDRSDYTSNVPHLSTGPTPFSTIGKSQAYLLTQTTTPGSANATQELFTSNLSFGPNSTFGSNMQSQFQLTKPPVGNKRGKI